MGSCRISHARFMRLITPGDRTSDVSPTSSLSHTTLRHHRSLEHGHISATPFKPSLSYLFYQVLNNASVSHDHWGSSLICESLHETHNRQPHAIIRGINHYAGGRERASAHERGTFGVFVGADRESEKTARGSCAQRINRPSTSYFQTTPLYKTSHRACWQGLRTRSLFRMQIL